MIGAVDIGGTKIAVGMVDNNGRVLSRTESPTDSGRGYLGALARIIAMLQETAREARAEITGIGIGSTGIVYPSTGAIGDADFCRGGRGKVQPLISPRNSECLWRWKMTRTHPRSEGTLAKPAVVAD